MNGEDVRATAVVCRTFLTDAGERDFTADCPSIGAPVSKVVAHVAEVMLWYATDLAAGNLPLDTMTLSLKDDASPADLIRTMETFAGVLAAVVDASPPEARGFHDWGRPDPAGFAAIGCVELLAHTWDAAGGLGVTFAPPAELARPVLRRVFPWAPPDADPWTALLWATGRGELPGRPRQTGWRWHSAPLQEWDGSVPGAG